MMAKKPKRADARPTNWCSVCDETECTNYKDVCNACYAALFYWKQKSVKAIVKRQSDLQRFARRMDLIGHRKGTNQ